MSKNKLAKFADMASYPNVFEFPFSAMETTPCAMRGHWNEFFANDNPITLELGCGRGEYTVGLAKQYPERNFIGVDIKGARMWSGATQALELGIKNAAFLRTNIEIIDRFFTQDEVNEIWITFPDPQMKKPTKRLLSSFFMERYKKILRDGGTIHLKTDSNFLYTYSKYLIERNGLCVDFITDDLYASGFNDNILSIKTNYEEQWIERGLSIKYVKFRLHRNDTIEEPDVEIELDDYRSYKRTKRTPKTTAK